MALSKVPKLPPFLQGPLACSPDRCNHPGTPLPPISPLFDCSHAYLLLSEIHQGLWAISTTVAFESVDRINDFVFRVVRSTNSKPSQILSSLATTETDGQLKGLAKEIAVEIFGNLGTGINGVVQMMFREGLVNFGEEHFDVGTNPRCLHDLLAPQDWQRLQAKAPRVPADELPFAHTSLAPLDPRPLFLRFSAAIASGQVELPSGPSGIEIWQDVVTTAQAICGGKLRRLLYDLLASDFSRVGYRQLVETPGVMLALSHHLLSAKPSETGENFSDDSSQISRLIRFCRLNGLERAIGLASSVPLVQYIKLTSQAGISLLPSPPPFTYRSNHPPLSQPSQAAFEFVKHINYPRERFPPLPPAKMPRFCPPSICSHRSPSDQNYERVDQSILKWFRSKLSFSSLQSITPVLDNIRRNTKIQTILSLASFDYATPLQEVDVLSMLDRAVRDIASEPSLRSTHFTSMTLVAQLAVKLVQGHSAQFGTERMPCLCDLTHMCDCLDALVDVSETEYLTKLNVLFASAKVPLSDDITVQALEDLVPVGESGDCWTAGWRSKLDKLFARIDIPILESILKQHYLFSWEGGAIYSSVTTSQIMEDVWTTLVGDDPFGASARQPFVQYKDLDHGAQTDRALRPNESRRMQAIADKAARSGDLEEANEAYCFATILDPTNAMARLNMASTRLRQADDSAKLFEWYRAIYYCSAALYYGPPKFKAYYRRGYALAHLKMYDKAILDFQQALLLEPHNPVPQAQLKLAKKKLKATRSQ